MVFIKKCLQTQGLSPHIYRKTFSLDKQEQKLNFIKHLKQSDRMVANKR